MSGFVQCPSCGLKHSVRDDRRCPRCQSSVDDAPRASPRPVMERAPAPLDNPFATPRAADLIPVVLEEEQVLAERGTRLVAQLIDGAIYTAASVPALAAFGIALADNAFPVTALALALGLVFPLFAYQCWILARDGQTLGKKAARVRVVRAEDGGNPGFLKAVVLRFWLNMVLGAVPLFGMFYAILDPLLIFSNDRRCLHDHLAGTKVVHDRRALPPSSVPR